jgi:diguanylate cyclase (GGDEF)-like protein
MIVLVGLYFLLVVYWVKRFVGAWQSRLEERVTKVNDSYHQLLKKKDDLFKEKGDLRDEALRIFTLYEITKEITKTLNEEDAFALFQQKLKENVQLEECLFIDSAEEEDVKKMRTSPEYFVISLQGRKRRLGYVAIKGIVEYDKEIAMILAGQFALALRRVKLYSEIEKIAITDSLTELHTRRYFSERFYEEINRTKLRKLKLSLLMIDVDYFKNCNDQYGHLTGDQILREIGKIIKENIRAIDIGGRFGGEEFCVVLPDTDKEGAQFAAERIRYATETTTIKAYDTSLTVTVSIGIATAPDDGIAANELIDKADWALYRAKKQGRNRICCFGVY